MKKAASGPPYSRVCFVGIVREDDSTSCMEVAGPPALFVANSSLTS